MKHILFHYVLHSKIPVIFCDASIISLRGDVSYDSVYDVFNSVLLVSTNLTLSTILLMSMQDFNTLINFFFHIYMSICLCSEDVELSLSKSANEI